MSTLEQIQQLEQRLYQAQLTSNIDELDSLMADDLLAVGPDGQLLTKADDLAAHRAGFVNIHFMNPLETTIKVLPDVAIVFVLMGMQVTHQGQLFVGRCRYTRVWAHQGGHWQVTAAHIGLVPA